MTADACEASDAEISSEPVAALDLGTNSCLLLVARRGATGRLEVVSDEIRTPRLGAGLRDGGGLDEPAVQATLTALGELLERLGPAGVRPERLRAVGTAVLRRAAEAPAFVARAREALGIEIEVLPGAEEAQLSWEGAAGDLGPGEDALVVDVGGGSTEMAWARGAQRLSAPVGALTLSDHFLGSRGEGLEAERSDWAGLLARAEEAVGQWPAGQAQGRQVIAVGGAAANWAALERGGSEFLLEGLERVELRVSGALDWAARVRSAVSSAALDSGSPGSDGTGGLPIEANRARILPAGLVCLGAALRRAGATQARFSPRGLRYGLAQALLRAHQ